MIESSIRQTEVLLLPGNSHKLTQNSGCLHSNPLQNESYPWIVLLFRYNAEFERSPSGSRTPSAYCNHRSFCLYALKSPCFRCIISLYCIYLVFGYFADYFAVNLQHCGAVKSNGYLPARKYTPDF